MNMSSHTQTYPAIHIFMYKTNKYIIYTCGVCGRLEGK